MKTPLLPVAGLALLALAGVAGWRLGASRAARSAATSRSAQVEPVAESRAAPAGDSPAQVRGTPGTRADAPPIKDIKAFLAAIPPEAKAARVKELAGEWSASLAGPATTERNGLLQRLMGELTLFAPEEAWRVFQRDKDLLSPDEKACLAISISVNWANAHGWENARQGTADAPEHVLGYSSVSRELGRALAKQPRAGEITRGLLETPSPDGAEILAGVISATPPPGSDLPTIDEWKAWLTARTDPAERESLALALAGRTRTADPKGTADWLMSLEGTPEQRGKRLNAAVNSWASQAPNACGNWLNSQALGPEADDALINFARVAAKDDPESAVAWAGRIHDPGRRASLIEQYLRRWHSRSPAAAAAAAERLGVRIRF